MRAAIPGVLGLHRRGRARRPRNLMLTRTGPNGEPLLVMSNEWIAEGVVPHLQAMPRCARATSAISRPCAPSCAPGAASASARPMDCGTRAAGHRGRGHQDQGDRADLRRRRIHRRGRLRQHAPAPRRSIPPELAALETAAGVIGAALHRERLVDDVRREREHAAEERVAELAQGQRGDPRQSRAPRRRARPAQLHGPHAAGGHAPVRGELRRGHRSQGLRCRSGASSRTCATDRSLEPALRGRACRSRARRSRARFAELHEPLYIELAARTPRRPGRARWRSTARRSRGRGALPAGVRRAQRGFPHPELPPRSRGRAAQRAAGGARAAGDAGRAADAARLLRQGSGRARRAHPHRPGNPRRARAGLHRHPACSSARPRSSRPARSAAPSSP